MNKKLIVQEAKRLEEEVFKAAMGISISQYRHTKELTNDVDIFSHLTPQELFNYNCLKQNKIEYILNLANVKIDPSIREQVRRRTHYGTLSTKVMADMFQWPHETIVEQLEGLFKEDSTLTKIELEEGVFLLDYVQANVIAMGLSWDYMKMIATDVEQTLVELNRPDEFLEGFVGKVKEDDKLIKRMTTNKDAWDFGQ